MQPVPDGSDGDPMRRSALNHLHLQHEAGSCHAVGMCCSCLTRPWKQQVPSCQSHGARRYAFRRPRARPAACVVQAMMCGNVMASLLSPTACLPATTAYYYTAAHGGRGPAGVFNTGFFFMACKAATLARASRAHHHQ